MILIYVTVHYSSLPYVVFGICQPLGGWVADHLIQRGWSETCARKGVISFAFLTGLLLIPAVRVQAPHTAIILIAAASLVGLSTGNLYGIIQACAPPQDIGLWTGFENFAGNIGGIIAPAATGFLIARTGSYVPGFAGAALLLITGLFAYWFVVGELKPQVEDRIV